MFKMDAYSMLKGKADFDRLREAYAMQREQNMQAKQLNDLKMAQAQREMEAPAQVQLKAMAEQALLKKNMGMPISAQEEAAITTMGQIAPPSFTTDQLGRTIAQPSGWGNILRQPASQVLNTRPGFAGLRSDSGMISPETQEVPINPEAGFIPVDTSQPDLPEDGLPQNMVDPLVFSQGDEMIRQSGALNSPLGQAETLKTGLDIKKDEAEAIRKSAEEKRKARREEDFAYSGALNQKAAVDQAIDKIINQVSAYNTGVLGSHNPLSQSGANIDALLKTIESDAALGKLAELKKAGGTLGSVTENELALLANSRSSLLRKQEPTQFMSELKKYKIQRNAALRDIANAYKDQFGEYPTDFNPVKRISAEDFINAGN